MVEVFIRIMREDEEMRRTGITGFSSARSSSRHASTLVWMTKEAHDDHALQLKQSRETIGEQLEHILGTEPLT